MAPESAELLMLRLWQAEIFNFLLTQTCQGGLENFLRIVRQGCCSNNNPRRLTFRQMYKILMGNSVNSSHKLGTGANCGSDGDHFLLSFKSSLASNEVPKKLLGFGLVEATPPNQVPLLEATALMYTAGYIFWQAHVLSEKCMCSQHGPTISQNASHLVKFMEVFLFWKCNKSGSLCNT